MSTEKREGSIAEKPLRRFQSLSASLEKLILSIAQDWENAAKVPLDTTGDGVSRPIHLKMRKAQLLFTELHSTARQTHSVIERLRSVMIYMCFLCPLDRVHLSGCFGREPKPEVDDFLPLLLEPTELNSTVCIILVCNRKSKVVDKSMCVCVCVFSSHPFWTSSSLDVPAGVTQEEGHTGFLIHLPSAVRALIFVARRIQPFLSLVDREVEFVY